MAYSYSLLFQFPKNNVPVATICGGCCLDADGRWRYVFICIIASAAEKPLFSATPVVEPKSLGSNDLAKCQTAVRRRSMVVAPSL